MTVKELLDILADADPDAEVRIGSQQSYPFQNAVAGVVSADEIALADAIADGVDNIDNVPPIEDFDGPVKPWTVYILEGSQRGYLSKNAWDAR